MNKREEIGKRVADARKSKRISQTELARRLEEASGETSNQMTVSRTEKGARSVPLEEAAHLSELLGMSLTYLATGVSAEEEPHKLTAALKDAERALSAVSDELKQAATQS